MGKLHLFELRSGHILLDGVTIRGIRECEFSIKENDSLAELSLKMDVRTLGNEFATQFDGALNETGKIRKCSRNKLRSQAGEHDKQAVQNAGTGYAADRLFRKWR